MAIPAGGDAPSLFIKESDISSTSLSGFPSLPVTMRSLWTK
jgi:hypothetical protein